MNKKTNKRKEKVDELTKKLEAGLGELLESDNYKKYLNFISKFHEYSLTNNLLIYIQFPYATRVASYSKWKMDFRHQVKKGAKGIEIFAPNIFNYSVEKAFAMITKVTKAKKEFTYGNLAVFYSNGYTICKRDYGLSIVLADKLNEREFKNFLKEKICYKWVTGFRIAYVFDYSQVEPMLAENGKLCNKALEFIKTIKEGHGKLLDDSKENHGLISSLFAKLTKINNVEIKYEEIEGNANGYYNLPDNYICISNKLSPVHGLKTLVHELAHYRLHSLKDVDVEPIQGLDGEDTADTARSHMEIQAESIAYIVLNYLNIDTSEYSFKYIAGWGNGEIDEFKKVISVVQKTAIQFINEIEQAEVNEDYTNIILKNYCADIYA